MSPKWPSGSGKGSASRFFYPPVNFGKIGFLDSSTPSMTKVDNRGEKNGNKGGGGMLEIVATNFVAS